MLGETPEELQARLEATYYVDVCVEKDERRATMMRFRPDGSEKQADSVGELLRQHMTLQPPELRSLGLSVPRVMDEVIQRLLRKDPREVESEMRTAAAAKWYELGMISQERGAEIAGLTRVEFMHALSRLGVSPFQEDLDEDEPAHA